MEEDHNHLIEVGSEEISLSIDKPSTVFNILNLTLQYVPYKIISPNPIIFHIEPSEGNNIIRSGILDPCDSKDITITAVITSSMNFQCFERNNTITLFSHEDQETKWEDVPFENIQRNDIIIGMIRNNYLQRSIQDCVLIAQHYKNITFTDEEKRICIDYVMQKNGKTTNYNISNTMLIFKYNQPIQGQVHMIAIPNSGSYFILRLYTPNLYVNVLPKYPIEPMSPQNIRKKVIIKQEPILAKSTPIINKEEIITKEIRLKKKQQSQPPKEVPEQLQQLKIMENPVRNELLESPQPPLNIINEHSTSNSDKQLYQDLVQHIDQNDQKKALSEFSTKQEVSQKQQYNNAQENTSTPNKPIPRQFRSEIIKPTELEQFKYQKIDQPKQRKRQIKNNLNLAPIVIEPNHLPSDQEKLQNENSSPKFKKAINFNVVNKINTYSKIKFVVLFRDHSYLLTVSDKEVITVWSLNLNSEEGKIRDHSELKKIKMINIYEWINSNERQFVTMATDQQIRVFSIDEMRLKYIMKIDDYSSITSIAFLPDKDQVCIAGTPQKEFSLFGSKYPKYRFLRFYHTNTLKEVLSYKVNALDGQLLNPIEYTDNENMKHARLNNILVVNKGYKDKEGGEIIFFMLDMNDKCTIILTLTYEQIQVYSVQSLYYLPARGSFVVVERNLPKFYQQNKIFVINVKQLQTEDGLKNGIVCKYFEEQSVLDDEIYVLSKQEYILKVKGDIVHLIDLKTGNQTNLQVSQQLGDNPQNIVRAGQIVRIDGESLQIIEVLS